MTEADQLREAVFRGDLAEVIAVLEREPDIDRVDSDGRTALQHAVIDGRSEIADHLIRSGADVNHHDAIGYTALHYAAQNHWSDLVVALLQAGASVDAADQHGNTPLWKAVLEYKGDGSIINALVSDGADPRVRNKHGTSPRDLAGTRNVVLPALR